MKYIFVLIVAWTIFNGYTALTCDGTVSPFYWPPVTQCKGAVNE